MFAVDERGGLYYQLFLCGLGHKKHPVLWMWKEPVFNFWETHKSLSLLSYLPQNWKQMLPFFIRLWTGQLWSCENKNPPVNLSCSLSSFFTLSFSSFFILTPLSLFSLLRFLVFVFFLSSLLTRLCRRCACVCVGGDQWCQSQNREHWENWRNAIQLQSDMTLEKGAVEQRAAAYSQGAQLLAALALISSKPSASY